MELFDFNGSLFEGFIAPQSSKDPRYIDYRDPASTPGTFLGRHRTHICLTRDGKAIFFHYGLQGNTKAWADILFQCHSEKADFQPGDLGLIPYKNGFMIDTTRADTRRWVGNINRYSTDLRELAQRLLDLKLATPETPLWAGNWAKGVPDYRLGRIGRILGAPETPKRLVLFHGTSNYRWEIIKKEGLNPLSREDRIWTSDKGSPEHRANSVYLTASERQAEYYAEKATKIDGRRYGPKRGQEAMEMIDRWEHVLRVQDMSDERRAEGDEFVRSSKRLAHWHRSGNKITPVVLKIVLTPSQFKNLRADDDYLTQWYSKSRSADTPLPEVTDWQPSLSNFAQVAYEGSIPPGRIKLFKQL